MKLLLDSCVVVWWLGDPGRLKVEARELISSPENHVWFSAASVWELGLKIARGKLRMPVPFLHHLIEGGFHPLSVTPHHAERAIGLPPIHSDPFDRLLISQAIHEEFVFVTRDQVIPRYPLRTFEA